MKVKVWGARGSLPAPGPETMRYGGNTTCVELTLSDDSTLVLDAGTGIRQLGLRLLSGTDPIHVLLTHLHLDHIQGLMFFAPLFQEDREVTIWGPGGEIESLRDRVARYVSAPLCPVEIRDLPARIEFREAPAGDWAVGPASITSAPVSHRGPTLGYRIEDGDASLCFLPDHEPSGGVSGAALAEDVTLLVHDAQYTDDEYATKVGWGHSSLSDALAFAHRAQPERVMLFHHDPMHHDDFLDRLAGEAAGRWSELGNRADQLELAFELREIVLGAAHAPPSVAA
jgi:phosphoribosyl 1,2-cyclic phosphodiesterase